MDEQTKRQIELILEHETDVAFRHMHDLNQQLIAKHAAKGTLQSGGTVKLGIRTADEVAGELLDSLIAKLGQIERSADTLALLKAGFADFLERVESEEVQYLARLATGNASRPPLPSIWEAAQRMFDQTKTDLARRLEVASFNFAQSPGTQGEEAGAIPEQQEPYRKKGGMPLAKHWDDMWANIAAQLYGGDLVPTSQADVKRAMFDWFNGAGISVGDTVVTERARKLWDALSAKE